MMMGYRDWRRTGKKDYAGGQIKYRNFVYPTAEIQDRRPKDLYGLYKSQPLPKCLAKNPQAKELLRLEDSLSESEARNRIHAYLTLLLDGKREVKKDVSVGDALLSPLLKDEPTGEYRIDLMIYNNSRASCLIETKLDVNLNLHRDQLVFHAARVLASDPSILALSLVLTDGFKAYFGYAQWDDLRRFEIVFEDDCCELCTIDSGKVCTPDHLGLKRLWNAIGYEDKISTLLRSDLLNYEYRLVNMIGTGSSSTVFSASRVPEKQAEYAIKFGDFDDLSHEKEIVDFLASHKICLPVIDLSEKEFLIFPLARPVVPSPVSLFNPSVPISLRQLFELWMKLKRLHSLGFLHRDIRLENILILKPSNEPFWTDFTYSVKFNEEKYYCGTVLTASQRVLANLAAGTQSFVVTPDDEIESFYKMYWVWFGARDLPTRIDDTEATAKLILEYWNKTPVYSFTRKDSYEDKIAFIEEHIFLEFLDNPPAAYPDLNFPIAAETAGKSAVSKRLCKPGSEGSTESSDAKRTK